MLPDSARTAAEAAAALGCEVGAIASSLVFDSGGEAVLVVTSGAHRVDVAKVAADHGLPPLRRAAPDFVRAATGQAIGGVSPVGHPAPVRTFVDRWLSRHDVVWAAGGHPHAVFPTTYDELVAADRRHADRRGVAPTREPVRPQWRSTGCAQGHARWPRSPAGSSLGA